MTPPFLFSLRHREPNSFNWGFCEGFLGFASHRMLMSRWQREVHYAYIYMTLCIALNVLRGGCQREIPLELPHWNTFLLYQAGIFERPSQINKPRKSVQKKGCDSTVHRGWRMSSNVLCEAIFILILWTRKLPSNNLKKKVLYNL